MCGALTITRIYCIVKPKPQDGYDFFAIADNVPKQAARCGTRRELAVSRPEVVTLLS